MKTIFLPLISMLTALSTSACLCFPSKATLDRAEASGNPVENFKVEQVPVQGYEVEVKVGKSRWSSREVCGELLAVSKRHIWVLDEGRTRKIPHSRIRKLQIVDLFPANAAGLGIWTALGTVSAISHGLLGILTGPIWLITGLSATGSAAASNDLNVDLNHLNALYQYARFPQGMPRKPSTPPPPAPAAQSAAPEHVPPPKPVAIKKPKPPPDPGPKLSGGFVMKGARMLWGMGIATNVRDPVLSRKLADARARKQIAVLIVRHLHPGTQPDITLENLEIADRWTVAGENAHYSIAVVELDKCGLKKDLAEKLWSQLEKEGLDEF